MSVISNNIIQTDKIEKINDIAEAKLLINQLVQEKEQLEIDLKAAKDKAIN